MYLKNISLTFVLIAFSACVFASATERSNSDKVEAVAIYYPHWHTYPHGESWKGIGWTEYLFMRDTKPRFAGHKQPIVPLLGELDSSKPEDVEKEIELAAANNVNVFLYDWYWYCGVKNMQEGLEQGFLKAKNKDKIKFAVMWANHDRRDAFRTDAEQTYKPWLYSRHSEADTMKVIDYCIENYFRQKNYWTVGGKIYFNIYQPAHFIKEIGGAQKTRELFKKIGEKMKTAGLPQIHWGCMVQFKEDVAAAKAAGFDSMTSYSVYLTNSPKYKSDTAVLDYSDYADAHKNLWRDVSDPEMQYFPVAATGFDTTPRWRNDVNIPLKKKAYPYTGIVANGTAEKFTDLLEDAKLFAAASKGEPKAVVIYAWNEWTEGGFLLPTQSDGYSYLEAVKKVFSK